MTTEHSTLLGALVFGNLVMLGWAVAAAVPVLIHLWNRQRHRELAWAAMTFLLAAVKKNSRRMRIEQIILLLVRTTILVCVACAWADIVRSSRSIGPSLSQGSGNMHTVLVLDSSFSMGYQETESREGGETHFQRAKRLAAELVSDADRGDGFTLVQLGSPSEVVIDRPAFDQTDVRGEIELLKLSQSDANLPAALEQIGSLLREVAEGQASIDSQQVYFFTDLGLNTWDAVKQDIVSKKLVELALYAKLTVVDLGSENRGNLALTTLEVQQPYAILGQPLTIQTRIRSFGHRESQEAQVSFFVDDRPIAKRSLSVPADGDLETALTHRFDLPGSHVVEVRLGDDALAVDNRRWLAVRVREAIRTLCIEGSPDAARFVSLALDPSRSGSPIQVDRATETAIVERDLKQYDTVFLCNMARISDSESALLRKYVSDGGGLVVFLGDRVVADSYNRLLAPTDGAPQLLPARLSQTVTGPPHFTFDPRDYRHPIVAPFEKFDQAGLLSTPTWKYFRLEPLAETNPRVALWFDSGDPAIVEQTFGSGRCILIATAPSPQSLDSSTAPATAWTMWPTWPSFPPIVHEMVALVVRSQQQQQQLTVGTPLPFDNLPGGSAAQTLEITLPDGTKERVATDDMPTDLQHGVNTRQSGIYQVLRSAGDLSPHLLAVNVDTRESDLQRLDRADLPAQLLGTVPRVDDRTGLNTGRRPLFRYFLIAVMGLLATESLLAWHFGRST